MGKSTCTIDGCDRPFYAQERCRRCYGRWLAATPPDDRPRRPTLDDRFWPKVDKAGPLPKWAPFLGPCWLWTGATGCGYGQIRIDGKAVRAHRVAYEMLVGPIPNGFQLDHLCRVRSCVRPTHLEPVTQRENLMRGFGPAAVNARRTHCKWGHEFTPDNTYISRSGGRYCKQCNRDRQRARYDAR